MKIHHLRFIIAGLALITLGACNNTPSSVSQESIDSYTSGNLIVAADESFKPVLVQEYKVFDSSYPDANININYLPESDCLNQLLDGKVKMVFATRMLTDAEKKNAEKKDIYTKELAIAKDGIAVIVNNNSQDTKMTEGIVESILTGKFVRKYNVVLDNKNGSIARYITDSILKGQSISGQVFAANNSEEVIKYVAENENAIGFVGMTHVFDPTSDEGYGAFRKDVKVVSIRNDSLNTFVLPYQASIALGDYPYIRRMYFIMRIESNLAAGFANFLTSEPGQLVIKKARLVPLTVPLHIRAAEIKP